MATYGLTMERDHLFLNLAGGKWLLDTGSPLSFGDDPRIEIAGVGFDIPRACAGLDAETISDLVGVPLQGLLGGDVLGRFDHFFDLSAATVTISEDVLAHEGAAVAMWGLDTSGVPYVAVRTMGHDLRLVFDTGSMMTYVPDQRVPRDRPAGTRQDFYPGVGRFQVETFLGDFRIGGQDFELQCGALPPLLAMLIGYIGADGVVGNAIMRDRVIGYFPRRSTLCL